MVADLAEFLGGEISGPQTESVLGVSKIDQSIPGSLSFLANLKYEDHIYTTEASVVLVNRDFKVKPGLNKTLIHVDDAYMAFCEVLNAYYHPGVDKNGIEKKRLYDALKEAFIAIQGKK